MRQRCDKPYSKDYIRYGGRGIKYCDKWSSFEGFWEDMQYGYSDNLTLDRIDNNKGYYKENCRWVDMKVQSNNKRNNTRCYYNGELLTAKQISEKYKINYHVLIDRLQLGWDIDKAVKTPIRKPKIYKYKEYRGTMTELCRILKLSNRLVGDRLRAGWSIKDALETPKMNCRG